MTPTTHHATALRPQYDTLAFHLTKARAGCNTSRVSMRILVGAVACVLFVPCWNRPNHLPRRAQRGHDGPWGVFAPLAIAPCRAGSK